MAMRERRYPPWPRPIGVTVPSLYLAFGNKESLFMQAVEHYGRYSAKLYEDAFRAEIRARYRARNPSG